MKRIIIVCLFVIGIVSLSGAKNFSCITNAKHLNVSQGNNYILMNDSIFDCRFSDPAIKYEIFGDLIRFRVDKDFKNTSLLLKCKNNKNYLLCLKPGENSNIHDLVKYPSMNNNDLELINSQLSDINRINFNPRTAVKTLKELNSTPFKSYIINFSKHNNIGLVLQNYKRDFQLKHYSLCLINKSEKIFRPGFIKIHYVDGGEKKVIYPRFETKINNVKSNDQMSFGFVLPKNFNHKFWVEVSDVTDHNKKISLEIENPKLYKGILKQS